MRLVVADDSMLTREGIVRLLTDAGSENLGQAGDSETLLRQVAAYSPDAAIIDIRMPPTHSDEGLVAAQRIRSDHPACSSFPSTSSRGTRCACSMKHPERVGYLLKVRVFDVAILVDALRRIADGETVVDPTIVTRLLGRRRRVDPLEALTARERETLALLAKGAERMVVTERTVEAHVTQIFMKLDLDPDAMIHRRVLAVLAYLRG